MKRPTAFYLIVELISLVMRHMRLITNLLVWCFCLSLFPGCAFPVQVIEPSQITTNSTTVIATAGKITEAAIEKAAEEQVAAENSAPENTDKNATEKTSEEKATAEQAAAELELDRSRQFIWHDAEFGVNVKITKITATPYALIMDYSGSIIAFNTDYEDVSVILDVLENDIKCGNAYLSFKPFIKGTRYVFEEKAYFQPLTGEGDLGIKVSEIICVNSDYEQVYSSKYREEYYQDEFALLLEKGPFYIIDANGIQFAIKGIAVPINQDCARVILKFGIYQNDRLIGYTEAVKTGLPAQGQWEFNAQTVIKANLPVRDLSYEVDEILCYDANGKVIIQYIRSR